MWKKTKRLIDKMLDFEYSDEDDDDDDDDCSEHYKSNSNHHIELRSIPTPQPKRYPVVTMPCEFCNVSWNQNLLLSHQISCPHNPANISTPPTLYARPVARENVLPTAYNTRSHLTTNSTLVSASTNSSGPNSFQCPITHELFVHPVLAEDGYTYEQNAIEQWIRQDGKSPLTRQPMTIAGLRPNRAIKDAVEEFRTRNHRLNQRLPVRSVPISFQYELNVDVRKLTALPFAQTLGKSLFHAEWIRRRSRHERLVLLYITGDRAVKEAQINVQLPSHPHIVRTLGLVKHDGEGMLLLQEYAERGNLSDLLRAERYPPTSQVIHNIILQIIDALIFLTEQGIVHGDLACRNVLVFEYDPTQPSYNFVKLTDFGISRRSSAVTSFDIVAVLSAAPEVLRSKAYSEKSDVWAFAVLAWEIFSKGSTPMIRQANRDFSENDRRILAGERLLRPSACPPAQWAIFLECMNQNPNQRPTFVQLKEKLLAII